MAIWTDVDGNGKNVKCIFCSEILMGGIYRFKNHLACTRKDVEPCVSVPDETKQKMLETLLKTAAASQMKKRDFRSLVGGDDECDQMQGSGTSNFNQRESNAFDSFVMRSSTGSSSKISKTQSTINQIMKKDLREEACQQ